MLAIITSPTVTPFGLAMISTPLLVLFCVATPRCWTVGLTTMAGLELIATGGVPVPLRVLVVKV
jgi:hypothetical protein